MDIDKLKSLLQTMVDHGIAGMPDQTIISWTTASIEHIERLEAENAKLKQDINKIKADAIREAANACCPASGYVVRDEQARNDLMQYADCY